MATGLTYHLPRNKHGSERFAAYEMPLSVYGVRESAWESVYINHPVPTHPREVDLNRQPLHLL